jgi:acetyl-CoA acetyltransferase
MASLLAGLPIDVPGHGQSAVRLEPGRDRDRRARAIKRRGSLMIAGGVESMSRAPFVMGKAESAFSRVAKIDDTTIGWRFVNPLMKAKYGVDACPRPPRTSRTISRSPAPTRMRSRCAASSARPQRSRRRCRGDRAGDDSGDERAIPCRRAATSIRVRTTLESLGEAEGRRAPDGTVTAGNASASTTAPARCCSQAKSAASARAHAEGARRRLGRCRRRAANHGLRPRTAMRKVLAQAKLDAADIDVIELNEAFAAQALAVTRDHGCPTMPRT